MRAEHGDPLAALDHITLAIRNCYDSGNVAVIRSPLTTLAVLLDRLGRLDRQPPSPGFAFSPFTASTFPQLGTAIAHLSEVLGDQTYESLARKGETMTTAEMVTYAYDQIDQARAELNAVSNRWVYATATTHSRLGSVPGSTAPYVVLKTRLITWRAAEVDADMESGSAHRLDVVVLSVTLLDGAQLVGKRRNLFWLGQYNPRQDAHPDCVIGSGLRIGGLDVPGAADAVGEFLQGCGITHFLHGQHMRVHWGDRASQRG